MVLADIKNFIFGLTNGSFTLVAIILLVIIFIGLICKIFKGAIVLFRIGYFCFPVLLTPLTVVVMFDFPSRTGLIIGVAFFLLYVLAQIKGVIAKLLYSLVCGICTLFVLQDYRSLDEFLAVINNPGNCFAMCLEGILIGVTIFFVNKLLFRIENAK